MSTQLDLTQFHAPFPVIDEDDIALAGPQNSTFGDRNDCAARHIELYVRVHAGLESKIRVRELQTHFHRARLLHHVRLDVGDLSKEPSTREAFDRHRGALSEPHQRNVVFVDFNVDPNKGMVGDRVDPRARFDPHVLESVPVAYVAFCRRVDHEVFLHLTGSRRVSRSDLRKCPTAADVAERLSRASGPRRKLLGWRDRRALIGP